MRVWKSPSGETLPIPANGEHVMRALGWQLADGEKPETEPSDEAPAEKAVKPAPRKKATTKPSK